MNKFFIALTASLVVTALGTVTSYGAGKIKESPEIKITIDGKMATSKEVPITQDGRTLLPLRAILTNLGVQNDDSHIIWDPSAKSIMVSKDSKKITLKVGDKKADINGSELTLDVPPVIYKNRTYIPARFIAESLDKKVVWDNDSKMILIKDISEFNEVKDILTKSKNVMNSLKTIKVYLNTESIESVKGKNLTSRTNVNTEIDYVKKIAHLQANMNMMGSDINFEAYYGNNSAYAKGLASPDWIKYPLKPAEFIETFKEETTIDFLRNIDTLAAGLVIVDKNNKNEVMLTGDLLVSSFSDPTGDGTTFKVFTVNKSNARILIDKNSSYLKNINIEFDYIQSDRDGKKDVSGKSNISFNEINGTFQINIPQDVLKNTREATESDLKIY